MEIIQNTPQRTGGQPVQTKASEKGLVHRSFPVLGLSCASCAVSVQSILSSQQGVATAAVNYATATAEVDYDPAVIQSEKMQLAVRAIGYDLVTETADMADQLAEKSAQDRYQRLKSDTLWAAVFSIPLLILSMWEIDFPYSGVALAALATPVVCIFGSRFFVNAYKQLLHGRAGMDTLVAMSTGVAYLYSLSVLLFPGFWASLDPAGYNHPEARGHLYFESAAVVITFILLGKLLEMRAKGRTSADIKKLMGSRPATATIIREGRPTEVPTGSIVYGDHLLVKPGEAIAVDGTVRSGMPLINESMITGEPLAVQKQTADPVYAGSINENTAFEMTATQVGSETVLASIINLVRQAQGSKAPIQQLVDKIAARFVAGVLLIAVITFICWWWLGGTAAISQGLLAVITVLIIACPCALGLATPAAIMVGIGRGATLGILIKDAAHLQKLATVTDIVLDKTGTLTTGKPVVQAALWLDHSPDSAAILQAVENSAQHPLAGAVADYAASLAEKNQPQPLIHSSFLPGLGIAAQLDNTRYYVGNKRLMVESGIRTDQALSEPFESAHQEDTIIYFADGTRKKTLAILALADPLKPEALPALTRLRSQHINIHMLTGDNLQAAGHIARQAGIRSFKAALLPADKLAYIEELQKNGKVVAMIGDGINDSAALAQADISIAMSKGSAVAMDVAGMTLVGDRLDKIPDGIRLSRLTNRTIRENLFWAFFYNLAGLPIAAGVLYPLTHFMLSPMIAGAAMALSSICVLAVSLRLRYRKLG